MRARGCEAVTAGGPARRQARSRPRPVPPHGLACTLVMPTCRRTCSVAASVACTPTAARLACRTTHTYVYDTRTCGYTRYGVEQGSIPAPLSPGCLPDARDHARDPSTYPPQALRCSLCPSFACMRARQIERVSTCSLAHGAAPRHLQVGGVEGIARQPTRAACQSRRKHGVELARVLRQHAGSGRQGEGGGLVSAAKPQECRCGQGGMGRGTADAE